MADPVTITVIVGAISAGIGAVLMRLGHTVVKSKCCKGSLEVEFGETNKNLDNNQKNGRESGTSRSGIPPQ